MNDAMWSQVTSQILYQLPSLVVYFVAVILAFVYMGRSSLASMLTLVGVGIIVLAIFSGAFAQGYVMQNRFEKAGEANDFHMQMRMVGIVGSCARALGLALLVAAIFVGRGKQSRDA